MACSRQARRSQPGPVATLLLFLGCQSLAGFILGLLQWERASRADGDRQDDYGQPKRGHQRACVAAGYSKPYVGRRLPRAVQHEGRCGGDIDHW